MTYGSTFRLGIDYSDEMPSGTNSPDVDKTKNKCLINIVACDEGGRKVGKDLSDDYFEINKKSLLLIVSGAI
jgi:hypothetical protein